MSPSDAPVEIDVSFDDELLFRIDRLRQALGYETRSDVVAAAIDAAGETGNERRSDRPCS